MKQMMLVPLLVLCLVSCQRSEPAVSTTEVTATTETSITTGTTTAAPSTAATETLAALPEVEGPVLRPVDEGGSDASFAAYRDKVRDAVSRKDAAAVVALVDPKIRTTFGEGGGVGDLKKMWKLDQPDSPFWQELQTILGMGGSFSGEGATRMFCAPYVYSAWPEDGDSYTGMAVTAEHVPLLDGDRADAKPIANLSYDLVQFVPSDSHTPEEWAKAERRAVVTADQKRGWVERRYLRSPIDWRACFHRVNGEWKMALLVKGD